MLTEPFLIFCDVQKEYRKNYFPLCPFCFKHCRNFQHQKYHLKIACPFAAEINFKGKCANFFCFECDEGFMTQFELDYHTKHNCWLSEYDLETYCNQADGNGNCFVCMKSNHFNCIECTASFSTFFEEKEHSRKCGKNDMDELIFAFENLSLEEKEEKENLLYAFQNPSILKEAEKENRMPALFICVNCEEEFEKRTDYVQHDCYCRCNAKLKTEKGKYSCKICEHDFF